MRRRQQPRGEAIRTAVPSRVDCAASRRPVADPGGRRQASVPALHPDAVADLTLVDPEEQPTLGICAYPGLEQLRGPVRTVVRKRNEPSGVALLTGGKLHVCHLPSNHVASGEISASLACDLSRPPKKAHLPPSQHGRLARIVHEFSAAAADCTPCR